MAFDEILGRSLLHRVRSQIRQSDVYRTQEGEKDQS